MPVGKLRGAGVAPVLAACLMGAILSVLVLDWVPSSDPWSWIVWGQEVASSKIPLGLHGGPSWKPFPVIFTSIFGLFGNAAPDLWLVVARAIGLLALVAAFRLGRRFAGPVAGVVAALALLLTQEWLHYMARGASEPVTVGLLLWGIDRHLSGSPRLAYFLGVMAALNRPELAPFVGLYALYLWFRVPHSRVLAVGLLALIPLAWLLPPWINVGNPLQAAATALGGKGSPGNAIAELGSGFGLMSVPTVVLAAIGAALALRRRDRAVLWLAAAALAWALLEALETQVAYGLSRYLLPGGAIACVLAGIAVVWIAELAGQGRARWVSFGAGALVLAATLPWTIPRSGALVSQVRDSNLATRLQRDLFVALRRAGGRRVVLPCRRSVVAVNHTTESALAWKMQVPLARVRGVVRGTGFVFTTPRSAPTGSPPRIFHARARRIRVVARAGRWTVLEVTGATASIVPHCATRDRLTPSARASL